MMMCAPVTIFTHGGSWLLVHPSIAYMACMCAGGYSSGDAGHVADKGWVEEVTGSHPSPLVASLLHLYPHAVVQNGSLAEDVAVLVQAQHLVGFDEHAWGVLVA
jgi:hypothetical protein